jgi:urea transporter
MPSGRRAAVTVITGAEPSQLDQLHSRQKRYLLMMGLRLVCLLTAAVAYSLKIRWAIPICVVGMVILPWMAVLIANDRPPLKPSRFRRGSDAPAADRAIEAPPPARVIDQ